MTLGFELQAARLLKHVSCSAAFTDAEDVFFRWQADDPVRTPGGRPRRPQPPTPPATNETRCNATIPKRLRDAAVAYCVARPFGMPSSRGNASSAVLSPSLCAVTVCLSLTRLVCCRGMRGGARRWYDSAHCPSASRCVYLFTSAHLLTHTHTHTHTHTRLFYTHTRLESEYLTSRRADLTRRQVAPLNMQRLWRGPVRPAATVAEDLRRQIEALYGAFLGEGGRALDYDALGRSDAFAEFVQSTGELQRVDLFVVRVPRSRASLTLVCEADRAL